MIFQFKKYIPFLLISLLCLGISEGTAQDNEKKKSLNKYRINRLANHAFKSGNYYIAIDFYKQIENEFGKNTQNSWNIAESYFAIRKYILAESYYQEVYEKEKNNPGSIVTYKLALSKKNIGKYEEAKSLFTDFLKTYKGSDIANYQNRAKKDIADCVFASEYKPDSIAFAAIRMDSVINTANSEFAPRFYKDKIIFSSIPGGEAIGVEEDNYPFVKLFKAEKNKEGEWEKYVFAEGPFNSPAVHTSNGSFSSDGKKFYFTRCSNNKQNKMICSIYVSEKRGNTWQEPVILDEEINNPLYTSTHPYSASIKKDEALFFVSDRPGGMGGKDIYVVTKKGGKFSDIRNLGNKINTPGDEVSPYYDSDNQELYFSSDGMKGFGGLDIYKSKGNIAKWKESQNVGKPLNSSADDYYYVRENSKTEGYFVSNRIHENNPSGCCDDIYSFKLQSEVPAPIAVKKDTLPMLSIIETPIIAEADTDRVDFSAVKKIEKNMTYTLNTIYFNFDDVKFKDEGKEELDKLYKLLIENPSFIIELSAHTDSKGSGEYNQILSQKRAESVKKYLVEKGIQTSRLLAKGYGENMPIDDNENPDGSDNPEGRRKNRRTEFKIISSE